MNNYRVEDVGEVDYFGIITKYFEYYRDDVLLINKCIDIKNNKANKIIYAIHALSNHAIKDFYYCFDSLYSDKIDYAEEKFCDDFYEDDYEIYDDYI